MVGFIYNCKHKSFYILKNLKQHKTKQTGTKSREGGKMFGSGTQTSNDDPAMLDNVKHLASQPADQVEPIQSVPSTTIPLPDPVLVDTSVAEEQVLATSETAHAEPAEGFSSSPMPLTSDEGEGTTVEPTKPQEPTSLESSALFSDFISKPSQEQTMTPPPDPIPTTTDDSTQNDTPQITSTSGPIDVTTDTPNSSVSSPDSHDIDRDQMASMKQEALAHLEPLSQHLDGTPEETFKTTMMMIQANDNHSLIQKALEAAKKIEDDKVRAQAMLDIVNEINYFCQVKTQE